MSKTKYDTAKRARVVCLNVGSIILWRPHNTVPNPRKPEEDAVHIIDEGVKMAYVKPAFS